MAHVAAKGPTTVFVAAAAPMSAMPANQMMSLAPLSGFFMRHSSSTVVHKSSFR